MKKILITGANSYIGVSFENYMKNFEGYLVDTIDMIDPSWRNFDFSGYDVVFHVAGIAHIKETKENCHLYYEVNRDMTIEAASKAKACGVRQFVFLSTMSVYGKNTGSITKKTSPKPNNSYGISKLQAEQGILELADDNFKISILRPPMVYGPGCKGNFRTVLKLAKKSPVFPKVKNQRSMIYIENLCAFVKLCIDKELAGIFSPQNREYVRTDELAKLIAEGMNKKLWISSACGFFVCLMKPFLNMIKKAFGTLIYEETEDFDFEYCVVDFEKSVKESIDVDK